MALPIGTISSPDPATGWLQGTVFAPSWGNLVQGNINGLIAGTGPTLKALQIDGLGGATSTAGLGHILISGIGLTTPSVAFGTGAGTSPVLSAQPLYDATGTISITTGTTPTAGGTVATITFAVAYPATPSAIILTPRNSVTAALSGNAQVFASATSATTWTITSGSAALTGSTLYSWQYVTLG